MAASLIPAESLLLALEFAFKNGLIKIELESNDSKDELDLTVKINGQDVQTSKVKL
jgi:hypothetical protein